MAEVQQDTRDQMREMRRLEREAHEAAERHGLDISKITGTGEDGAVTKADVEKAAKGTKSS